MRPTIVFSSSDSSEYEDDEKTPGLKNSNNANFKDTNTNTNEENSSDSYEYSSEIVVSRTANKVIKRPIALIKKGAAVPNINKKPPVIKLDDDYDYSDNESFKPIEIKPKPNHEIQNKNENKGSESESNKLEKVNINFESNSRNIEEFSDKNENEEEDDEDELNPPVVKIGHVEISSNVTFALSRKIKSSIRGKRFYYYFYSNSEPVFCAKAKTRHPDTFVPICEGTNVHLKGESQFNLVIDHQSTVFSLRKYDKPDEEMLKINFFLDSALLMLPRHVDVEIFASLGVPKMSLTTKKPKMSSRGNWVLDFHNKFTIPSEKNMIFVSSTDKESDDLLLIRKISSNNMEIDSFIDIPEIGIFAIALSIFLAKLG